MCFSHLKSIFLHGLVPHLAVGPPIVKRYGGEIVKRCVQVMRHVFCEKSIEAQVVT